MKTIYKYPLVITDRQSITLPVDAQLLDIQTQPQTPDQPQLWALHELPAGDTVLMEYHIRMIGTGHRVPDNEKLRHISTIQIRGGTFVLHSFEQLGQ